MSKIIIEELDNGYIIDYPNPNGEGRVREVCEADSDYNREEDLKCVQSLMYRLKEALGCYYSKHREENLVINIEKEGEIND